MSDLDQLGIDALRARAAPFLNGVTVMRGLHVDVASGMASEEELSGELRRVTFKTGRKALHRLGFPDRLDADELGTAVARSAGLPTLDVYRASRGELYTALPPYDAILGIDLPDLPPRELRAVLNRLGAAATDIADGELGEWAMTAILDRTHAGQQLRAVDAVTGTAARHPGEWAVIDDRLIPIGFPGAWQNSSPADVDRSYLDTIRSAVDALRPQFAEMRRAAWHDQTLAVFRAEPT